jgi:hypothetical protein
MLSFRKRSEKARVRRLRPLLEGLEGRVVLSTLNVNTSADTVAVNPLVSDLDKFGNVSLRSAIEFANDHPKSDTIVLPEGTFKLADGELEIAANLTIKGSTKGQTDIDGN